MVQQLVYRDKEHPLVATKRDIELNRVEISDRLQKWHSLQAVHMSSAPESTVIQETAEVEHERILLPSCFSKSERQTLGFQGLADEEAQLRIGQAIECIIHLRRLSKKISAMHDQ